MEKKKAYLSQPMKGHSLEWITKVRDESIKVLEDLGYEVVNTKFTDKMCTQEDMEKQGVVQPSLAHLAMDLDNMSKCHAVYFCDGWHTSRSCRIELEVAKEYDLTRIFQADIRRDESGHYYHATEGGEVADA